MKTFGVVQMVKVADVRVPKDRREAISEEVVADLVESIGAIGLLHPITISESKQLIAGLHRLEATRRAGRDEIPAIVKSLTAIQAEMVEIDENIVRKKLSILQQAELMKRRKRLYEAVHPETKPTPVGQDLVGKRWAKHGDGVVKKRWSEPLQRKQTTQPQQTRHTSADSAHVSEVLEASRDKSSKNNNNIPASQPEKQTQRPFVADTAAKIGASPRVIHEQIQIADRLSLIIFSRNES